MKGLVYLALIFSVISYAQSEKDRPKFKKQSIQVAGKTITVEIADSPEKRSFGLMYQTKMPKNQGMLFVFDNEETLSFWMKNTKIPLDIGYFNSKCELKDIQTMEVESLLALSPKTYPSKAPAKFALEMNKGWFRDNGIKIGSRMTFSKCLD